MPNLRNLAYLALTIINFLAGCLTLCKLLIIRFKNIKNYEKKY